MLNLQVRLDGQTVWLTQKLVAELFDVSVKTANEHVVNIYDEGELAAESTIPKFRIVQTEGSRQVSRLVDHYNLEAIVAVGLRVRSARCTSFRQWAISRLTELLKKGFTLDDERIKAGPTLGDDYFEELLARIRDIRSSERMFWQKVLDIYATSIDYDGNAEGSHLFSRPYKKGGTGRSTVTPPLRSSTRVPMRSYPVWGSRHGRTPRREQFAKGM